jgi:hypothetical protein
MFISSCVNKHGKYTPVKVGHAKIPNALFPDFANVIRFDVPLYSLYAIIRMISGRMR